MSSPITELGLDVMFYGGMQIDRGGSVNLHYIPTAAGLLRGPGLANSTLGHTAARTLLYTERHDRRTLVESVDYASVIGHHRGGRSRAELGLPNAGPVALFTPDVLFRPDRPRPVRPRAGAAPGVLGRRAGAHWLAAAARAARAVRGAGRRGPDAAALHRPRRPAGRAGHRSHPRRSTEPLDAATLDAGRN